MDTKGNFKVEFFVDERDSRIVKEAKSFRRTRPIDEIRPKWSKIRLGIKRFVRDQRRKAQKENNRNPWSNRKNTTTNKDGVNEQSK